MSMDLMVKAFKIKVGNPLRKLVLIKLADNASDIGECWPSLQYIADQCEISRRSVIIHIDALCDAGLLLKQIRTGPKGNSSNLYRLTLNGAGDSLGGSAGYSLRSAAHSPGGAIDSLGGSAGAAPRISHSFEPINEPVNEPLKPVGAQAGASTPVKSSKVEYSSEFENAWKAYPARQGSNPKNKAYQAWNARLRDGVTAESMQEGVKRYAAYQMATGKAGTEFVMQGSRFFGPGLEFESAWTVAGPQQPKPQDNKHSGFNDRDYGTTSTPTWARGNA
jgi:hypothetical protein